MKNPRYKVEIFYDNKQYTEFFHNEAAAWAYGDTMKRCGRIVFILEEIDDNLFHILEEM